MLNGPIELKPCPKCGILPVKDKRKKMLGSINDGGYTITQGRYRCPNCQLAPSWGKSYCIDVFGWTWVEVMSWNDEVEAARASLQPTVQEEQNEPTVALLRRMRP